MATKPTEVFGIDLDNKDFNKKVSESKGELKGLGDGKSMEGLMGSFKALLPVIATATAAFFAAKKSLDWALEAEGLKSIELQFDILTKQSGIHTKELRDGLAKVNNGLVNETDLLKMVNEAMLGLGKNAERLPEVLELARKAAVVMGTDTLTAFKRLNEAIIAGSSETLRRMGESHRELQGQHAPDGARPRRKRSPGLTGLK